MSVKFVIVGAPRTGSTLLVKTLHGIDGVHCHGELLGDMVRGYEDGFDPLQATQEERQARAQRLINERGQDPLAFVHQALEFGERAGGFKALYGVFHSPQWQPVMQALMDSTPLRFIHLVRGNELRRYVSEQVLRAGGPIHSLAGGRSDNKLQVTIDIADFERARAAMCAEVDQMRELLSGREVLEASYEALSSSTGPTVAGVCDFLGLAVDAAQVEPALKKVGSADLRDTVSNFEELLAHAATRELALSE